MFKIKHIIFLILLVSGRVLAAGQQVKSPDSKVSFHVFVKNDSLCYRISFQNKDVIETSPIRMTVDSRAITGQVKIGKRVNYQLDETYPWNGTHSVARNHFNGAKINLQHGTLVYTLDVRVFNDGASFRLIIPGKPGVKRIPDESTVFRLPAGTTAWYHDLNMHYEGEYAKKGMDTVKAGEWAAPSVTFRLPGSEAYLSVTEADLKNYGGMALQTDGNRGLVLRLPQNQPTSYPYKLRYSPEDVQRLSQPATITGTITTPWRVVMIADGLNALVNNDMVHNLCPPPDPKLFPQGIKTAWVQPGSAVWKYLDNGGEGTLEEMKAYSRQASELGFRHNILEGFWKKWSDADLKSLVDYSKAKGVHIWLWEHSKNLREPNARRAFLRHCHDLGIGGLKIDFFDHEAKEEIDLYQSILRETAELKIMVDFHGANKPTGQERTWPHELTREAVKGMEASKLKDRAGHNVTLPFTRFVTGQAEYTPVHFGERRKNTTWAHQIASAAIFSAPLLTYSASPQNMLANPAVGMIKSIPSMWDETIVLPGSAVGEVAVFARRSGTRWFLAVMNGAAPRDVDIPLSFLGEGSFKSSEVKDVVGNTADVELANGTYDKNGVIRLKLGEGGGFIAEFLREGRGQAIQAGNYKAVFTKPPSKVPTSKTPDGPLAGNGDIGLTLGGNPDRLLFYLGKNDFWRAYPVYPGGGIALPGWLEVAIPALTGADYYAEQAQDKAEITGKFTKDGLTVSLKSWVSATANTVVIELDANKACEAKFLLKAAEGNTSVNSEGDDAGTYWVTRSFENTPLLEWPSHVAMAAKVLGTTPKDGHSIPLEPGKKVTIVVAMYTNHDTKDWKQKAISVAQQTTQATVDQLRKEHHAWWAEFWAKSSVKIGDPFIEQYYYASQYLFGATSRGNKFAPGIWGPFITKDSAAWGGDYHLNYNYQAPYWAAYSSNHIDETDNFDQPLLDYMEKGKQHARDLLGIRGIYYPVGIGPKGLVTTRWPLTPDEMERRYASRENTLDGGYKFLGQKINAVFSVGNMLMRFYSTYDATYARRVYPYMLECANFWEDYLKFENGRYVIYQDHYNEVMPNLKNKGQWRNLLGDFNSTLSVGLVKMLFKGMIDVSTFLNRDLERVEKWQHIVKHMSRFTVGEVDGKLSLKNVEISPSPSHSQIEGLARVSIHGLVLPSGICGPVTDSSFNGILLDDIGRWKQRMKGPGEWGNTLGNGIETCFPAAVRVGYNSDEIIQQLKDRIQRQSLPNLWITAEGGGIETLAAVPLTVNEMLMQSYEGVIRLFPNWNKTRNASFDQLRAYGAFLVSGRLEQGRIGAVKLLSEAGRPCNIENPWPGHRAQLIRNGKKAEQLSGSMFSFRTQRSERLELVRIETVMKKKYHFLLVTGGHGFKEVPFYNMIDSLGNFSYDKLVQPKANELIASPQIDKYDALVFYDMNDSITPSQQQAYLQALQKGKAMIFLHHALVSYQGWDEFQRIIGGRYYAKATVINSDTLKSSYEHDVVIPVKIENRKHPVTKGLADFEIYDEVYGNFGIQPTIRPLLSTTHPGSSKYIAWINPYGNSDILFIQLGHGPEAFGNSNYRKLLAQGIEWSILRHQRISGSLPQKQ